jgi:hypothetical protein
MFLIGRLRPFLGLLRFLLLLLFGSNRRSDCYHELRRFALLSDDVHFFFSLSGPETLCWLLFCSLEWNWLVV